MVSKKIAGEATSEELGLLEELINTNPEWKTNLENLQELWNSKPFTYQMDKHQKANDAYLLHINRLKEISPDFDTINQGREEDVTNITPLKSRYFSRFLIYSISVLLFSGAIVAMLFLTEKKQVENSTAESIKPLNEISIGKGSRSKIELPDGSKVWINSGSKLSYENYFKGNMREVQLDGEAYFDVVKDAAHPFIVHTSGIDIKVLGTAFNVKAYLSDPTIEATLIRGSIEVIDKKQPGSPKIMLKPHEKLVYNKFVVNEVRDQRADVKPVETDTYSITIKTLAKNLADSNLVETAWVYNKLVFEDERMEDLAIRMEKWYNLKISFSGEKIKNSRVSGSFVNETAVEALKELQFLVPFGFTISGNEVKIMRK